MAALDGTALSFELGTLSLSLTPTQKQAGPKKSPHYDTKTQAGSCFEAAAAASSLLFLEGGAATGFVSIPLN